MMKDEALNCKLKLLQQNKKLACLQIYKLRQRFVKNPSRTIGIENRFIATKSHAETFHVYCFQIQTFFRYISSSCRNVQYVVLQL